MKTNGIALTMLLIGTLIFILVPVTMSENPDGYRGAGKTLNLITSVPRTMSYQGILKDSGGNPVLDSTYNVTFRIFDVASGGSALWIQILPCTTSAGYFNAVFSNVNLSFNEDYWLEMEIDSEILDPRQKIGMVGYAAKSDTADFAWSSPGGGGCNWTVTDNIIRTNDNWGIARGNAGNMLYGNSAYTHVNLGINSNTGISGEDYSHITISGGRENEADSSYATVGGGFVNQARGTQSTVGGGYGNDANGTSATVAGGSYNKTYDEYCSVGGGYLNEAQGYYSTIAGGAVNHTSIYGFVGGGSHNTAGGEKSSVICGQSNAALGFQSSVGGGQYDTSYARRGGVFCGYDNLAGDEESDTASFIGGGRENSAIAPFSSIVGGELNTAAGKYSVISGGYYNTTSGEHSVVGGGWENEASGDHSNVGGGDLNVASGLASTIGGGGQNISSNTCSVVAGGVVNIASGMYSAIGGGNYNEASGHSSTVGGGSMNLAGESNATVSGGANNKTYGYSSVIGGGSSNRIDGSHCVVPGGHADTIAAGSYLSFAFGTSVYVNGQKKAVFFDGDDWGRLSVNRDDNDGGIIYPLRVGTNEQNGNGAYLTAGGTWTDGSGSDFRENFSSIGSSELISKISSLEISLWNYKDSDEKHIGPVAEDFVAAFDVGVIRESDGRRDNNYLAASDVAGVALGGVKELIIIVNELKEENEKLRSEIDELKRNSR